MSIVRASVRACIRATHFGCSSAPLHRNVQLMIILNQLILVQYDDGYERAVFLFFVFGETGVNNLDNNRVDIGKQSSVLVISYVKKKKKKKSAKA